MHVLNVEVGLSSPELCYFSAPSQGTAGIASLLELYSVDALGNILDNLTDEFSVQFSGPTSISIKSTYVGYGKSTASFILTKSGTYTAFVTLYGAAIKGSPFFLTILPGSVSTDTSTTSLITLANSSLTAGTVYSVIFTPLDSYLNPITTEVSGVSLEIIFDDNTQYASSLGVSQPSNWTSIYGLNYSGYYDGNSITFVVYRAGNYQGKIYINNSMLKNYPVSIQVEPSSIYAPYCVAVFSSSQAIAGTQFTFNLQTRDMYYNNLLITSITSVSLQAIGPATVIGDLISTANGVFQGGITMTIVGTYSLILAIDGLNVQNMQTVTTFPGTVTAATQSNIVLLTTQSRAGNLITATIYSNDLYSNLRTNSDDIFVVTVISTTSVAVSTNIKNNNNGSYTVSFTPTLIGTYTVTATLFSTSIGSSGGTVTITQTTLSGNKSLFSTYTSQTAGSGSLTIVPKDLYGNSISNLRSSLGVQYFYADFQGPQNKVILASFQDFSFLNINLAQITLSGTYSILLSLVQQGGLVGFYYSDNQFLNLQKTLNYYNFNSKNPDFYTAIDAEIDLN